MRNNRDKTAAVQAFEFTYELAWKTMKRLLEKKGIQVANPRDCFREAAINEMIKDPKKWFDFIKIRNITIHTYEETILEKITETFDDFSSCLAEFMEYLENERASVSKG